MKAESAFSVSEADAERAAETLRALRDLMLVHDGVHYVLVGTTQAVSTAVHTHAQVREIVGTVAVTPLSIAQVHELLRTRYAYLCVDPSRPVVPPAEDEAVAVLYDLYRGDLRGLLRALEHGVEPLIGLGGATAAPLGLADLRSVLAQRCESELASLDEARVEHLRKWGEHAPASEQTQRSLKSLWRVAQGTVSKSVNYLIQKGYVIALPRAPGRKAETRYVLSGVGRLIFG